MYQVGQVAGVYPLISKDECYECGAAVEVRLNSQFAFYQCECGFQCRWWFRLIEKKATGLPEPQKTLVFLNLTWFKGARGQRKPEGYFISENDLQALVKQGAGHGVGMERKREQRIVGAITAGSTGAGDNITGISGLQPNEGGGVREPEHGGGGGSIDGAGASGGGFNQR